jgi:hypothetical protein
MQDGTEVAGRKLLLALSALADTMGLILGNWLLRETANLQARIFIAGLEPGGRRPRSPDTVARLGKCVDAK